MLIEPQENQFCKQQEFKERFEVRRKEVLAQKRKPVPALVKPKAQQNADANELDFLLGEGPPV